MSLEILAILFLGVSQLTCLVLVLNQQRQIRNAEEDIDRLEAAVGFLMDQIEKLNPNILLDMGNYFDELKKQLK